MSIRDLAASRSPARVSVPVQGNYVGSDSELKDPSEMVEWSRGTLLSYLAKGKEFREEGKKEIDPRGRLMRPVIINRRRYFLQSKKKRKRKKVAGKAVGVAPSRESKESGSDTWGKGRRVRPGRIGRH